MIGKYISCDTCAKRVEVPLEAPMRDLLPEAWYALVVPAQGVDAHFCSERCLAEWSAKRAAIGASGLAEAAEAAKPPRKPVAIPVTTSMNEAELAAALQHLATFNGLPPRQQARRRPVTGDRGGAILR